MGRLNHDSIRFPRSGDLGYVAILPLRVHLDHDPVPIFQSVIASRPSRMVIFSYGQYHSKTPSNLEAMVLHQSPVVVDRLDLVHVVDRSYVLDLASGRFS
jgi:hypothetical protein